MGPKVLLGGKVSRNPAPRSTVRRVDPQGRVRLADIRETPLSVDEVMAAVSDPACGGVAVFVGRVRDHDHGQQVAGLSYSAHPTAAQRMAEIGDLVVQRHAVEAVAALHRVGDLAIGELAVVVAAGAAHRDAAFEAGRDFIDTIKAEVPIWKHQRFTDGSDEWVGCS